MQDYKSDCWSEILRFVQFMKSKDYYSEIKIRPYKAFFAANLNYGLQHLFFPKMF